MASTSPVLTIPKTMRAVVYRGPNDLRLETVHVPCLRCHAGRPRGYAQCATYKRTGITARFEPAGGGLNVLATDLLPARLKLARTWGAKWVLAAGQRSESGGQRSEAGNAARPDASTLQGFKGSTAQGFSDSTLQRITHGRGLDAAILATPANALVPQAQACVRGGGQILLFAHTKRGDACPLDLSGVRVDEQDLLGSYSCDITLLAEVARLVFSRRLDVRPLITHRFPLGETVAAVALAARPTPESLKVTVVQDEAVQF